MILAHTLDTTKGWPYDAHEGFSQDLVQPFCVRDANWQRCRLSMKGKATHEKLAILKDWRENNAQYRTTGQIDLRTQVQIDNYLGALRRGGQLDRNNMIKKYR